MRHAHVHRHGRQLVRCLRHPKKDVADDRSIAVGKDEFVTAGDNADEMLAHAGYQRELLLCQSLDVRRVACIATNGHDDAFRVCCHFARPYYSNAACFATSACNALAKHCIGACTMPAPMMPIPGSLCAIAVLMTGRMLSSMTLRMSMPTGEPTKSRAGSVKPGLRVMVMRAISREYRSASCGVPPTN